MCTHMYAYVAVCCVVFCVCVCARPAGGRARACSGVGRRLRAEHVMPGCVSRRRARGATSRARTWALASPPAENPLPCTTSRAGVKKSDAASSPLATAAAGLRRPALFFVSLLQSAHEGFGSFSRTRGHETRAAQSARTTRARLRPRPSWSRPRARSRRRGPARHAPLLSRPERGLDGAVRLARSGAQRQGGSGSVQRGRRRRGAESERPWHRDGEARRGPKNNRAHLR